MSTRLTKWDRDNITKRMVAAALKERRAAHTAAEHALAKCIFEDALGDPMCGLLADLPEGFVPTISYIDLSVGGGWMRLNLGEATRCPHNKAGRCWIVIDGGTPKADAVLEIETEEKAIKTTDRELTARIAAALSSFRTVEAMVEAWPETEPFAPKPKPKKDALPAVVFADLNATIAAARGAEVAA